jgi:hypothetical protein
MKKLILISISLLLISSIFAVCNVPKKIDIFKTMKGNIYDKEFKPYGQIIFNKNQMYISSVRLIQDKEYQIVAINGKNITCIKKIKSYPTLMSYCNNSYCGGFEYCKNLNKKNNYLKNAKYYLYNVEDVNCTSNKIIKNKPILKEA